MKERIARAASDGTNPLALRCSTVTFSALAKVSADHHVGKIAAYSSS
jgi:hypothetical protein